MRESTAAFQGAALCCFSKHSLRNLLYSAVLLISRSWVHVFEWLGDQKWPGWSALVVFRAELTFLMSIAVDSSTGSLLSHLCALTLKQSIGWHPLNKCLLVVGIMSVFFDWRGAHTRFWYKMLCSTVLTLGHWAQVGKSKAAVKAATFVVAHKRQLPPESQILSWIKLHEVAWINFWIK